MAIPETDIENVVSRLIYHVTGSDDTLMARLKSLNRLLDGSAPGILQAAEEQVIHKWALETATELVNKTALVSGSPSK